MVEAALRALAAQRSLARISGRAQLRWSSAAADVVVVVSAYLVAVALRAFARSAIGLPSVPFTPDWSVAILVAIVVSVFYASGLYELEAYVSRPLHLWVLVRASLVAFAISALLVYAIKSRVFDEPRLILVLTFVVFILLTCALRLGLLDTLYVGWARQRRPVSFVMGDSPAALALADRLSQLRGFDRVERVAPDASPLGVSEALKAVLKHRRSTSVAAGWVFIDASGCSPRDVVRTVAAAQACGAEVYVVSRLLESLEGNSLLSKLFDAPVVRARRSIDHAQPYMLKRGLDVVGSAALLLVLLPITAVLGAIIRLTSPGQADSRGLPRHPI